MKIIDPHVDLADLYIALGLQEKDFFQKEENNPISLKKLKTNEVDILGLSLYVFKDVVTKSFYESTHEYLKFYKSLLSGTSIFSQIQNSVDITKKPQDSIGFFYTLEGLGCLRTPQDLYEFYDEGVRMVGLTWDFANEYATGRQETEDNGVSSKGKEVLKIIDEKHLPLDIAHLSEKSVKDANNAFEGIIFSTHSNVRSVWGDKHNLTDDEIQIIVDRNGVVGLMPLAGNSGPNGTFDDLYKHFEYIASKWGIDYVGFTSDIFPLEEYPFIQNYNDITIMKALQEFLLTKLSPVEVEKVMHENWLRILKSTL